MSRKKHKQKKWQQRKQQTARKVQQKNKKHVRGKTLHKRWCWVKRKFWCWMPVLMNIIWSIFMWVIENYDNIKAIFTDIGGLLALLP